ELGARGLTSVFCEGGSALAASLLKEGLVDELVCFSAGFAIGAEGLPAIGGLGLENLDAAKRFKLAEVRQLGADVLHRWEA
ncbi:MAG: dihydrofolate reductase family protein, partial [Pseudomonadota bacterium]